MRMAAFPQTANSAIVLAPDLQAMAEDLRRSTAPGGCLVLSGVLVGHYDHVLKALGPMVVTATTELEGWAAVQLRHP